MIEIYADPMEKNTTIETLTACDPGEMNGVIRISFQDAINMMFDMIHSTSNEISQDQWVTLLELADEIIVQNFLSIADGTCMSCHSGSDYTDERCQHCRVFKDVQRSRSVIASALFRQKFFG